MLSRDFVLNRKRRRYRASMMNTFTFLLVLIGLFINCLVYGNRHGDFVEEPVEGMVIATTNGKALFLYKQGKKHPFPDFHTITAMGFNGADIKKMKPEFLQKIPKGTMLEAIAPPPE